jgi:hypothetical protein
LTEFWRLPEFWKRTLRGQATEDAKYDHAVEFLSDNESGDEEED